MRTGSVVRPNSASTRRQRGGGFFGGVFVGDRRRRIGHQQRFGIRRLFVHLDAHVVDHADDVFDLLRIDDVVGQVIVDLGVGQVAVLLAERDQVLQARVRRVFGFSRRQFLAFEFADERLLFGGQALARLGQLRIACCRNCGRSFAGGLQLGFGLCLGFLLVGLQLGRELLGG